MISTERLQSFIRCIDNYMISSGKSEINEMEANRELSAAGMLDDEVSSPGKPLRELLAELRDANRLPQNISQRYGAWKIKLSRSLAKGETIFSFS